MAPKAKASLELAAFRERRLSRRLRFLASKLQTDTASRFTGIEIYMTSASEQVLHKSKVSRGKLRNVELYDCTISTTELYNCRLYNCKIKDCKLVQCEVYAGEHTKITLHNSDLITAIPSLTMLPLEIRNMIYEEAMPSFRWTPMLLKALRADKFLHAEAMRVFNKIHTIPLPLGAFQYDNLQFVRMSASARLGIRNLEIFLCEANVPRIITNALRGGSQLTNLSIHFRTLSNETSEDGRGMRVWMGTLLSKYQFLKTFRVFCPRNSPGLKPKFLPEHVFKKANECLGINGVEVANDREYDCSMVWEWKAGPGEFLKWTPGTT